MPRAKDKADTAFDAEGLAERLAAVADTLTEGCALVQRRRGAGDSGARVLQRVEGALRHAADVLAADGPAAAEALASLAEPEPEAPDPA